MFSKIDRERIEEQFGIKGAKRSVNVRATNHRKVSFKNFLFNMNTIAVKWRTLEFGFIDVNCTYLCCKLLQMIL